MESPYTSLHRATLTTTSSYGNQKGSPFELTRVKSQRNEDCHFAVFGLDFYQCHAKHTSRVLFFFFALGSFSFC